MPRHCKDPSQMALEDFQRKVIYPCKKYLSLVLCDTNIPNKPISQKKATSIPKKVFYAH